MAVCEDARAWFASWAKPSTCQRPDLALRPGEQAIRYGSGRARDFFQGQGYRIAVHVACQTGIYPSVLLAQMAIETAYGSSRFWMENNNPAGLHGGSRAYRDLLEAADDYARILNLNYYCEVRLLALEGKHPDEVAKAMGRSPFSECHYRCYRGTEPDRPRACTPNPQCSGTLATPGGALILVMRQWDLYRYDTGFRAIPPQEKVIRAIRDNPWLPTLVVGTGVYLGYKYRERLSRLLPRRKERM